MAPVFVPIGIVTDLTPADVQPARWVGEYRGLDDARDRIASGKSNVSASPSNLGWDKKRQAAVARWDLGTDREHRILSVFHACCTEQSGTDGMLGNPPFSRVTCCSMVCQQKARREAG